MSIFLLAVLCFAALVGISLAALLVGILIWQHYSPREARSTLGSTPELEGGFAETPPSELGTGLEAQIPSDVVEPLEVLPEEERSEGDGEKRRPCSHVLPGRPCAICMGQERFKREYGDWRDD